MLKTKIPVILNNFKGKKIIVWGDIILDEYIYTSTGRISREAPVLVTEYEYNDLKPGGAGNVIMNLKSMGAEPIPAGFVGDDADGVELKKILADSLIDVSNLVEVKGYKTPKKSRILSGSDNTKKQQILRIDLLNKDDIPGTHVSILEKRLKNLADSADIFLVSDYLKRSVEPVMFSNVIEELKGKTIIIDSREHLLEYKGVTYATPNEPEIKNLFPGIRFDKKEDFVEAGTELLNRLNCRGIVLKRGHKGMIVFEKNKEPVNIPIYGSQNIVDVTGAGDTVISLLSLALSAGADLVLSAQLANIGASMVVMKEGAYPLGLKEFREELGDISF
ncbi:MAG: bifunctional ADP-heptose synthase [Acidobacteriota bacterium]